MGIHHQIEGAALQALLQQAEQQRRMGVVTAVDQCGVLPVVEQHAVGRQPPTFEHMDAWG
jgi:hypothetical protein